MYAFPWGSQECFPAGGRHVTRYPYSGLVLVMLAVIISGCLFNTPAGAGESPLHSRHPKTAPLFAPIGHYRTDLGDGSAETVAGVGDRIFVTNSGDNSFDIVDIANPAEPILVRRINLSSFGAGPNSIAAFGGMVAVAVEADPKTDPGAVIFFDKDGNYLNQAGVGALPDMLTFTPNGRHLLVANEGEPGNVDPEGSVSIIEVPHPARMLGRLVPAALQHQVRTINFKAFSSDYLTGRGVRLIDPNAAAYQDLEPEYITVSEDSRYAWVSLQENNAIALLDILRARFLWVHGLGLKNHSIPGNGIDASDKDDAINIRNWPVFGMYQPDAIARYQVKGQTYLISANEGDARDAEESRVKDLHLDPAAFPDAADLKKNENLGRLTVTNANGDFNADGFYEELWAFGARSFSIWTAEGQLVYDSGDDFERIVASRFPADFNSDNDENTFDTRSDNKGPEPEGVAVGRISGRTYAFIGLERMGGVMIYDITDPHTPRFIQYANNRDFNLDPPAPDSGPEVLAFVPPSDSPTGRALLLVANEVSGTVSIYQAGTRQDEVTLTLVHKQKKR